MPQAARKLPDRMTTAEFFEWEGDGTTTRYELVHGELVAMAPATGTHSRIQANMAGLLFAHLRNSRCSVLTEAGVVPSLTAADNARIPDLAVTCAPDLAGSKETPDPILLVEILSPGNKYKTWDNVWAYASIATVREILILSSWSVEAKLLRRDAAGAWPANPAVIVADASVTLETIALTFELAEAYAKTHIVRA